MDKLNNDYKKWIVIIAIIIGAIYGMYYTFK